MSLVDDLLKAGHRLRAEGGGNHRVIGYAGLIVKGDSWYSHSLGRGGGVATLPIRIDHATDGLELPGPSYPRPRAGSRAPTLHDPVLPPERQVYQYLGLRGIPADLIAELARMRRIGQDGKGYVCFVGYDDSGRAGCISCRAMTTRLQVQKYDRRGSNKRHSFSIPATASSGTCIIVEGPVDALSIACLENLKHRRGYFQTTKIATCGSPTNLILSRLKQLGPDRVCLAFDNDDAGQAMTRRLREALHRWPIRTVVAKPGAGKDPNDWWLEKLGQS